MAMTKKEIYAKHGINYDNKADKIEFHGIWVKPLLKQGNSKVGKRVYTFSMPAGTDGTCICDCKGCYAKSGHYKRENVKACYRLHQCIVETDINWFIHAILAQLETIGSGVVRIHASGDFNTKNSMEYFQAWKIIISSAPSFLFWTYTKMSQYENGFDGLENANIVKSIIDGIGINYGHCGYIIDTYKALKKRGAIVYICRCGIDKNQHCENCHHCAESEFVLFVEHSTEYKAEKDPRYNELVALIESQDMEGGAVA